MKIGIITFHRPCNYGAVLQAMALYQTIKNLNKDCEIIDYENDVLKKTYTLEKPKDLKSLIKVILFNRKNKIKYNKFKNFINKNCILSKKKYDKNNIIEVNSEYDKFITGSDQVWNLKLTGEDYSYLLEFVKDDNKKFSYASSFGQAEIPEEYSEKCKKLFEKYSKITVREKKGKEIIESLINKTVNVVLDPTLLLDKNQWEKIERRCEHNIPSNYILAYFVSPTKQNYEFAKKISQKLKMKIILINYGNRKKIGMKNITTAGPEEFLWLMRNANYVVTNSFHGIAFAINFNKEFFYQLSNKAKNGNSRIENLINICNLSNRNEEKIDINNIQKINWTNVNEQIEKEREKSIENLKEMLN